MSAAQGAIPLRKPLDPARRLNWSGCFASANENVAPKPPGNKG